MPLRKPPLQGSDPADPARGRAEQSGASPVFWYSILFGWLIMLNRIRTSRKTRRPIMIVKPLFVASIAAASLLSLLAAPSLAAGPPSATGNPDFTKGDKIPEGADHDWNLGATGARGWMFSDKLVTTDARQIAITEGGEEFTRRRNPRGRRRDPGRRWQTVFLRSAHRVGQGAHDGRIGSGRRKPVADPLAGRQDARGRREAARPGHLQRHRALRLPQVATHSRTGLQGCSPNESRILPTGRTRSHGR